MRRSERAEPRSVQLSKRQVIVAMLMMMILSSWALDSMHIRYVPSPIHNMVASMIDSQRDRCASSRLMPEVDDIVAHNPLDDSPITFGSVILLGVVCAVGLAAMAFSSTQAKQR